ncbi:abortive infection family protein [Thalassobaculum sp. OXR-137]|uniref:abortive infection family protein n=1 Tax=Rhodospirillales TaxID=204441 RepID=UPI00080FDC6E|nr:MULTISPECIES: abortive infection family protein [Rhodospirillales]MCR9060522.1 abortive infection family protein [Paracoccaceae bacterium]OCK09668.1 Abortive infection protein-like, C-terminal domain containing protein [Thalassospira sp. KO164]WPZ34088.1 abortive infection family protein [Thalassobaculum sp. OXR-137]SEE79326.1 Abortive infection C-terminus [Thalassospira permensis]
MPFPLSPQSIDAIAEVISGGGGNDPTPPIGIYRSGPKIEKFMRACNVDFRVSGSRVPSLVDCLLDINRGFEPSAVFPRVIEAAADPRDFAHDPPRHTAVLEYLNNALRYDGFEIQQQGTKVRLVVAGHSTPVIATLSGVAETISFDTVKLDLERALGSIDSDPEDAITAACSTIESVCRSILIELGQPLPAKKDVSGLFNAVKQPLALSPDRSDLDQQIAADVRTTLGGLATVIQGVGALRTHAGDAHGREKGYARVDARIARLAIHAASTVALFLIETWQRKFPSRTLHRHDEPT